MTDLIITTPEKITDRVRQLCNRIDRTQKPRFVPVRPEPYSRETDCFFNVDEKINRDGGSRQIGWMIWEMRNVFLEGEFHAVWVSEDGKYVDITPKKDGEKRILFQPDSVRTYNREPVDNIRLALRDDPAIHEYIALHERLRAIQNQYMVGKAAPGGFPVVLPPNAQQEVLQIQARLLDVQHVITRMASR